MITKHYQVSTKCQPSVSIGKDRLGKDRLGEVNTIVQLFDDFWNFYGKKKDKHKCFLKFKRLSMTEIEAIKKHLPGYIKSTPDIQYRKNPLTYLNGKCWNDEVILEKTSFEKTMDAIKAHREATNAS